MDGPENPPNRHPIPKWTMIYRNFLVMLLFLPALSGVAAAQVLSDRIEILTDDHGYFPCMDCHGDQESITTPRILEEEHAEPFEWEDSDGVTHLVTFGDRVSIGDLRGSNLKCLRDFLEILTFSIPTRY